MHLLGSVLISLIFYELYGGLRNDLCNDASVSMSNCMSDAVGKSIIYRYPALSYIFYSLAYTPVCEIRIMTKLIECYGNVTDSCPDYRDAGPALMNVEAFTSFIIGTCVNRNAV
ncbi:uncharacterized protein LOC143078272 [Mytilus galloprovincialis]|uniref:uncharacterized protein LOC143078272 n=1 Tax=Mytilus galloprovincialis TaxID=29158 RepID=UPI003F7C0556